MKNKRNIKKSNYSAWSIDEKNFPRGKDIAEQIKFLLGFGILAPSTHNTQPWIFQIHDNQLSIEPDFDRSLKVGDPDNYGLYLSLGACAENIKQAARHFGLSAEAHLSYEGVSLAFEKSAGNAEADDRAITNIKNRQSHKLAYEGGAIGAETIKIIENCSTADVQVVVSDSKSDKEKIIANHLRAAKAVAENEAFVQELCQWLRPNKTSSTDGMPGFVIGNSNAKSVIGKALLNKNPRILSKMVNKDRPLLESASAFITFVAKQEANQAAAAECGMVVEKVWLKLTELGLAAHPLYAAIQDAAGREELTKLIAAGGTPMFFMRIGKSSSKITRHTPRATANSSLGGALNNLMGIMDSQLERHSVQIGKYAINYIACGSGEPVLLLHGANIGWPQWHLNLDSLAKNFRVYAIDLPGAGGSTKVKFSQTDFEKDYLEVVDEFISKLGFKKLDIVGSSFGGWIAMRLAIEHRPYINRLVVANPIGFTRHMPLQFRPVSVTPLATLMSKTALKPVRKNKNLEKFMRDVFYEKDRYLRPEFVDYFYELSKESHNVLFISRLAHYSGMRKELFLAEDLHKISVPTMVIWGKKDPLMPYSTVEGNIKLIKDVELHLLEDAGHMPPVEAADQFNKLVAGFLKRS